MKTLKFVPELCELILTGEKTATWRLFDDKDLSEGDDVQFLNNQTLEIIGTAKLIKVTAKPIKDMTEGDMKGHEQYSSQEELIAAFKSFYGDNVSKETEIKIIYFSFSSTTT